jgi:hypothetical protein
MSPFWSGFFEQFRSCGRNGGIFVAALATFFGVLIVGLVLRQENLIPDFTGMLFGIVIITAIWLSVAFRRARRSRTQLRLPPLSDDELRVAKAKLKSRAGRN